MYTDAKINNFSCVSATLGEWAIHKERTKNVKFKTLELTLAYGEWRVFFSFCDQNGDFCIATPFLLHINEKSMTDELNEHFEATEPYEPTGVINDETN